MPERHSLPVTAQATFCAVLVDEWARAGLTDAVVAPGSRSTPLALAVADDGRIRVHVHHDERAAGFVALGLGLASGHPAIVLTTSGTAAAELHPAIVESHQAGVPLIACTADRPPELQDVGAPQTIDQTHLYGRAVRWFCDPGVAVEGASGTWRSIGARSVAEAIGGSGRLPGPVHLNLAFRDPLAGEPAELPEGRSDGAPWHRSADVDASPSPAGVEDLARVIASRRGVLVVGGDAGDPADIHALAEALDWPVVADPRSGCRLPLVTTIAHADALLRVSNWANAHRPDVVVRLGAPPASKVVGQWLTESDATQAMVAPSGAWWDPDHTAAITVRADPGDVVAALLERGAAGRGRGAPSGWLRDWAAADEATAQAIAAVIADHAEPTEPGIARSTVAALPAGATLVIGSSMPIRDVEWYAAPRDGLRMLSNRGANGIDGVVSTAVGVSLAGPGPTAALVGDIAFLHDANALLAAPRRGIDLTVVVVDNDGGGIFSFLPQAGLLPGDRFEQLFGTPHGVRVEEVAAAYGIEAMAVEEGADVDAAIRRAAAAGGVSLVVARTDRTANVKLHAELTAAVAAAVGS
ncbi:MAG: 2-succinyl-5-enolpyruvyl-6-hydroxy-3-cyclohexene-1-carboxylic-acid synthase [Acidimicrobiales bacterium]